MLFIKIYKFDGNFERYEEEINYAIDDFYREFSIFPNVIYTSLDGILNVKEAALSEVKLYEFLKKQYIEQPKNNTNTSVLNSLTHTISKCIAPDFFCLEFNVNGYNILDVYFDDDDDDDDNNDDIFLPTTPKSGQQLVPC